MLSPNQTRATWLEVDLDAIGNNIRHLRNIVGAHRTLFAVVKANAYGHGATLVAPAALDAGADRLAVASVNEGIALREAGIEAPILVLGYAPPWQAADLLHYDLVATVYDLDVAKAYAEHAADKNGAITVHVKVDTGMHRLGLYPAHVPSFLSTLSTMPSLVVEGLYTHFSTADEADKRYARRQFEELTGLLTVLEEEDLRPPLVHCANSAAILSMPVTHLDGVRAGIALYGLDPSSAEPVPSTFRPALRWVARVAQVKDLRPGDPVSYGNTYIADSLRTVAVVPVGYADGFVRSPHNWGSVLIAGFHAPICGSVCMDQTIVDVTEIVAAGEPVRAGDEVVIIGEQRGARLGAEAIAERLQTVNYEVVSRIMARVPRIPVYGSESEGV